MDTGLLKQARARFGVELHPALCSEALAGIQEILNARLLRCLEYHALATSVLAGQQSLKYLSSTSCRYSEDLSGVLLGYTNERILSMKVSMHLCISVKAGDTNLLWAIPACKE